MIFHLRIGTLPNILMIHVHCLFFQDTGESLIAHVKEMNEILYDEEEEEIIFSEEDAMLSPTDIGDILANTREIEDFVDQV